MTSKLLLFSKLNKSIFFPAKYQPILQSSSSVCRYLSQVVADGDSMTQGVDTHDSETDTKPTAADDDHQHVPTRSQITEVDDDRYNGRYNVQNPNSTMTSSAKLQTPGVNTPIDPHKQQRRTITKPTESMSCEAGPVPEEEEERSATREEEEEDDKEYFKDHKASPLSKIEIGDTRKPLEKVGHGTADAYFGDQKEITWTPEQVDTAEESLLRATEMFREAAARGVPEWPHSRRLRELRGEDW